MTYARLWDTFSRSKRAQEQVCRPPGSDVASIPARLFAYVKFLPVSLLGALELYRASLLDPGYKGGGHSFRATRTKLAQINPGSSTNCWLKLRRHRSICLEVIQVRSLSDPAVPGWLKWPLPQNRTAGISKSSTAPAGARLL